MLKLDLNAMNALQAGTRPVISVKIYFQQPEIYDMDGQDGALPFLQTVSDITTGMSAEGGYEISNATITLRNAEYYFSRKFARELPNNKILEMTAKISGCTVVIFRGTVSPNWTLTPELLTVSANA